MSETTPHYIVITVGTNGDLHPMMRIAQTLQSLGRQVTFVSHSYYENMVRDAGLAFIGVGTDEEFLRILRNPDIWNPRKGLAALMANYGEGLQQTIASIRSISTAAPKMVIAHPFAVPGAIIARELGLVTSVAAAYLAPSNLRTCHDPLHIGDVSVPRWVPMSWRRALWHLVEKKWVDPVALGHINAVRLPLGLPAVDSFLTHISQTPDLAVTLFPSWFAPTMPDWPHPLLEGDFQLFESSKQDALSSDLSAFLAAGEKPVVFTPGTGNLHAVDFFRHALAATQSAGRRAIFLTREQAQIPSKLPASVIWQAYVPLKALLPHVAALVHHGGIGTTAEALRAGIPQLIVPFAWDQFDNGARIAAIGVGQVIPAKRLRPRKLAHSLHHLCTSDTVRAQCATVASRFTPAFDAFAFCKEIERQLLAIGNGVRSLKKND